MERTDDKNAGDPWTRPKKQDSDSAYGRLFRNRHIFLQLLKSFVDLDFVRDLLDWMGKLFPHGPEPVAVQQLRNLEGATTMLSELVKKVNRNAVKAAKYDKAYLEGILEGKLEGKLDTAKAMLRNGIPLQTVLLCTGLTEEQLARDMKKDSNI
jgi:hypothetical protein